MSTVSTLFDAPGPRARRRHALLTVLGVVLAIGGIALVLWKLAAQGQLEPALWKTILEPEVWTEYVVPGIINTLKAAALAIVFAGIFGVLLGMGRLAPVRWLRWISSIVVEFFRAVPVLLMMYFFFQLFAFNNVFGTENNSLVAVVLALTLYNGSVIAELVRSGVHNLPKGQAEAGLSIGLTPGQTLRSIQLPQALTSMLPALVGQLVVVLKDTALGTAITYPELLQQTKDAGTAYGAVVPMYILAAVLFIAVNYVLSLAAQYVEQRLRSRGSGGRPVGQVDVEADASAEDADLRNTLEGEPGGR